MDTGIVEEMRQRQRLPRLEEHKHFANAVRIVKRLKKDGHFTVLAGGCVRDGLLGITPSDLDLATSATPEAVEAAFERTLNVGKAFGTIVVVEDRCNFEVTTFRTEGPYLDGRHPSNVHFTNAKEDAKRRDFTVNALFYDVETGEVLDFVGGLKDLAKSRLQTVGLAAERFGEDRLRMLRAARFVSQLGFELDPDAFAAIRAQAAALVQVSVERVLAEMRKLLVGKAWIPGLKTLVDSGLAPVVWPEIVALDFKLLEKFPRPRDWTNAVAMVHWLLNVDPEARLRAWKASRDDIRRARESIAALKILENPKSRRAERVRALGTEFYADVLNLASGDCDPSRIQKWIDEFLAVADAGGGLPKSFVSGEDLLRAGVAPGEFMGRILKEIYEGQLEGRLSSRAAALEEMRKKIKA